MNEKPRIELTTMPTGRERQQRRAVLLILGTFALSMFFLLYGLQGMPWNWPWAEMVGLFAERPHRFGYVFFAVLAGGALVFATRLHLVFDENGLRFFITVPGFLKFAQPDWFYRWDEIERIENAHATIEFPAQAYVVVHAGGRMHRVPMLGWRRAEHAMEPVGQSFWKSLRPERSDWKLRSQKQVMEKRLADSELLKALAAYGMKVGEKSPAVDALARSRMGISLAVISIGAMLYATAEMLFGEEAYAAGMPLMLILSVATFAGIVGYGVVDSLKLKAGEKIGLPILLAGVLGAASYPGIIRLNILLDPEPAIPVSYRQDANLRLIPESNIFPALRIERYDWYWQRFDDGHVHEIVVRRGGLGIWTYNAAELRRQIRERDEKSY